MDTDDLQNKQIQYNSTAYSVHNVIGTGYFSRVYKATDSVTDETVVIKVLNSTNTNCSVGRRLYLNELSLLNDLKSSPIRARYVDLKNAFLLDTGAVCFVMEKLGATLHAVLRNIGKLPMLTCRSIVRQIAQGLAGLKRLGIVHADLKPDNIMFCEGIGSNHRVKIIDFGLAFYAKNSYKIFSKQIQAVPYRAPEVCFQKSLSYGLDLWALGCIMPEIVTGVKLFDVNDEAHLISHMVHILHVPEFLLSTLQKRQVKNHKTTPSTGWLRFYDFYTTNNYNNQQKEEDIVWFVDLVYKMLTIESNRRITAVDALSHPYLTMIHFIKYPNTAMTKSNANIMKTCKLDI